MKLNFKDLKQQKFTIDAEPSETVADVKQKVAAEKGFDATQMRLIWSGKILSDANTIGSYEIKPTDQIVCMVQKPKAAPAPAKAPATPAPAAADQTPAAPAPAATSSNTSTNASATPSPAPAAAPAAAAPPAAPAAPATSTSPRGVQDSSMVVGPERQLAMTNLENMGFERSQVEAAMRAAFYHPDRAVEYLLNGIPESAAQPAPPQAASQTVASPPAAPAAAPPAPAAPVDAPAAADSDEPVNLFEAAAAANQGNRGAPRGAAAQVAGGGTGAATGSAAEAGTTNLEFLRNNPTFQQLRQLVQQQPQMLEQVLQNLSASNPQLAQTISQNQEQFIQLLAEDGGGEGGATLPPGAQQISVTPEERDAIERLCRLGFDRDVVIQAYFACDKNEELAANFLFDNPDDDVDQ